MTAGGVMKRLDLAINDKAGILDIPKLKEKYKAGECMSYFRMQKDYSGTEKCGSDLPKNTGETLYLGSTSSELYMCAYQKNYEQYVKNGTEIEDTEIKNRFEIRMKNERAYYAVVDLLTYRDAERTAFSIINHYVRFVDREDDKPKSQWITNDDWAWFVGENREPIRLTTKPEPYTLQKALHWLQRQVAPTIKMVQALDRENRTTILKDMIEQAELKDTGLTAQDIKDKVKKYMIETYERFDFIAETAEGMYLYDENGTPYLDFYAGIAVNNAGSRNPKVVAAVKDQVDDIMHTFNYPYTIPQALLAEKVCKTIGMDKIFYQNSGTEANEAMIKMARKYGIEKYGPNRYHIVTAKDGFHGRTFGAMSATGQPGNGCQVGFGPMTYGFSYAPYNDLKAFKDACTENTIAIMIEPVQGEGGVHPATPEFMKGLREFCDEKGMLLLIDEVQTGWCRTGAVMSYMNYGIKPDIVSMAKGLGGGMPIGAICATEEVSKAFSAGSHGTTFGGHPVCCAAALAEVNELLDRDLAGNAKKVGDYFAAKLEKLPHVKEVRHQGLLVGVEFDDTISGVDVKHGCFDRHMLITAIGSHIIRMVPPLIVSEEECDKAFDIIKETVESLS